ncbi:MAG: ammonium transporter [Gammaproteobacteria bacterium]|nr:MAG: ammonium transporter [Gammaproteobacteria bacterium]
MGASVDVLFLLVGAVMVLAMHAGFAFLELGTVRTKNQVNALSKILGDFCISAIAYYFIGYQFAYGINFFDSTDVLMENSGYELMKFFFLLTFAAAIPAIVSGGVAERARLIPLFVATFAIVAFCYPMIEGIIWNGNFGFQSWLEATFGASFHDFAGSIVVHGFGGWIAFAAVYLLGVRRNRFKHGFSSIHPPSSIPFLALGSWILIVGWFGFNVISAQRVADVSGLVAINSLMAMVGGTLTAMAMSKNDPGFMHNGPLAGLVAVCAGSDVMHPLGSLFVGGVAGAIFVFMFTFAHKKLKTDDVLGVWAMHGVCGLWGGIACGVFGQKLFWGQGGVSIMSQLIGSLFGVAFALICGFIVYGVIKKTIGLRLSEEQEFDGADLSLHKISSTFERDIF